jgi:type I restriction enzyme M protein
MFVQSERFVKAHGGRRSDISVFGQESIPTTWRLARMNLAIRGIEAHLGDQWADSFFVDKHPDLKADFVLANPPFNVSDWGGERLREDKRWVYGVPPVGNANFAWVQHIIHHLAPNGVAGFVLANGSLSSNTGGEGEIRKAIIQADLVDCVIAMPEKLFYSTPIPVCLWFLSRNKAGREMRDRRGETLFIDARRMGTQADRIHRELSDSDIRRVAGVYHSWRGEKDADTYEDVAGFCKAVSTADVEGHGFVLTPGRYTGIEEPEDDEASFAERLKRLGATLETQIHASRRLDDSLLTQISNLLGTKNETL